VLSLIDKTTVANVIAALAVISGIVSVFLEIPSSEMLLIITGAGIGYLFKNNIPTRKQTKPNTDTDPISTQ